MGRGEGGRRASQKETRDLLAYAVDRGWSVVDTKNGWVLRAPDGVSTLCVHTSPRSPTTDARRKRERIDRIMAGEREGVQ